MNKKEKKRIIKIVIVICVILLAILCIIMKLNNSGISYLEYDILVEDRSSRPQKGLIMTKSGSIEEGDFEVTPKGGYANIYYYTVINSEKKEKYTIVYQYVYAERNKDAVSIEITTVSEYEIQEAIKKYGLSSKKIKLKKLLDNASKDKYHITEINNYIE